MPYLKMLWQLDTPTPYAQSWDYWTSVTGVAFSIGNSDAVKKYNKIAYYAVFKKATNDYRVLFISPDFDAAEFEFEDYTRIAGSTPIYDVNNIGWYWAVSDPIENGSSRISQFEHLLIDDNIYSSTTQAVNALINKIYAVPFHEDYQTGQTYTLTTTNLRRTIRKAIGTYLHRKTVRYREGYAYKLLSDDADNIIDLIITEITNKGSQEGLIYISIPGGALSFDIAVLHGTQGSIGHNTNQVPNATLTSQGVSYNYERKYFRSDGYAQYSDVGAYPDWVTYVHIVTSTMSYETINAYSTQVNSIPYMAGLNLFSDMVSLTNLGIDL